MRMIAVVGTVLILTSMACVAIAADSSNVTLSAQDIPIEQTMADLSKQSGKQILCDSDVKATISAQFGSTDLDKLLDTITKSNNLKWQKLYLPAQPDKKPTLEQVKARAEAVAAVTGGTVVVYDPATGKQRVFVEQDPSAPSVSPDKLGLTPVYLISKPTVATKAPEQAKQGEASSRLQSLQNERAKLMAEMSPEQRVSAMQQEMLHMIQLDPATRQQMILAEREARRNMPQQMRENYQQIMRDTMRSMREQGLITGDQRNQNRGNRNRQRN